MNTGCEKNVRNGYAPPGALSQCRRAHAAEDHERSGGRRELGRRERSRMSAAFGDLGERVRSKHYDSAALESYPPCHFPRSQLLVGALARHADELAELSLRDRDLSRPGPAA